MALKLVKNLSLLLTANFYSMGRSSTKCAVRSRDLCCSTGLRFGGSNCVQQGPHRGKERPVPYCCDQCNHNSMTFGELFNHSLEGVTLPSACRLWRSATNSTSSLQTLTIGQSFNQRLEGVTLPDNLHTLTFGQHFNQSLEGITLPRRSCRCLSQRLESVTLPNSLQMLTLGGSPNQRLDSVSLPSSLQTLIFGGDFNLRLASVTFPSMQNLVFDGYFNQSLEEVTLPSTLQTLTFSHWFNRSLEGVTLPSSLQTLTFGQTACMSFALDNFILVFISEIVVYAPAGSSPVNCGNPGIICL